MNLQFHNFLKNANKDLEKIFDEIYQKISSATYEVRYDLNTLNYVLNKEDKHLYEELRHIYRYLLDLLKSSDESRPFLMAKLVVDSFAYKADHLLKLEKMLNNLVVLNTTDLPESNILRKPRIRSMSKLIETTAWLKDYLDNINIMYDPTTLNFDKVEDKVEDKIIDRDQETVNLKKRSKLRIELLKLISLYND